MDKQVNIQYIYRSIFFIIVTTLSISPAILTSQVDSRNYLLIICMGFGPIMYLFAIRKVYQIDKEILGFLFILFTMGIIFNFSSIRWSSLFFTGMFLFYFLAGIHCAVRGKIGPIEICWISKILIYCYLWVLIIQQICVLLGLPVFNANLTNPSEPWKLNALAAEPSHTSRYVGVLMFAFLYSFELLQGKKFTLRESLKKCKRVWMAFGWIMLTTVSGTGILIFGLIISMFLSKKNAIFFFVLITIVFIVGMSSEITALKRSTTFLSAVATGDSSVMVKADHSASVRIVPWILCLSRLNPLSFTSWIGEGAGTTSKWMSNFMPGVPKGWSGGGMANFMVEYGLIVGFYYLILTYKCCRIQKYKICSIGLWIMCIVLIGINMQMAWLCMLVLFILNNLSRKNANKSILQLT